MHRPAPTHRARATKTSLASAAALAALLAAGCSSGKVEEVACEGAPGVQLACDFRRPEDMALLPDRSVLVAERGFPATEQPAQPELGGRLSVVDPATMRRTTLRIETRKTPGWGAPDCQPGTRLAPLGIDLKPMGRDGWRLAVVNHDHGSEALPPAQRTHAVELYQLARARDGSWGLIWRGCAIPGGTHFLNDVVWDGGDSFFVTQMLDRTRGGLGRAWDYITGADTGALLHYHPGEGFVQVPNSAGSFPNGVVADPQVRHLYINYGGADEIRVLEAAGPHSVLHSIAVPRPDNSSWLDGRLWVASQRGNPADTDRCQGVRSACPMPFAITSVDGASFEVEELLQVDMRGFGAASVVLPRRRADGGWEAWVGSFQGDRLARIRLGGVGW